MARLRIVYAPAYLRQLSARVWDGSGRATPRRRPTEFFTAQGAISLQKRTDLEFRSLFCKQHAPRFHRIAWIALVHGHLVHAILRTQRTYRRCVAHGPENEQPDTEFALRAEAAAVRLETPLD